MGACARVKAGRGHRGPRRAQLRRRRARRTDQLHVGVAGASVNPSVDAEAQPVRARVHVAADVGKTVEHNFGRTIRHTVGIAIRDEENVWGRHDPHAAVADREAHEVLDLVREDTAVLNTRRGQGYLLGTP